MEAAASRCSRDKAGSPVIDVKDGDVCEHQDDGAGTAAASAWMGQSGHEVRAPAWLGAEEGSRAHV
jgi:hypothetical protein